METDFPVIAPLSIVGDAGVDLVLGTLDGWPAVGTELLMPRSELRAGGSGANSALAARHIGQPAHLISAIGNDPLGQWLAEQFAGLRTSLEVCDRQTTMSVGLMHACGDRNFFTTQGHLQRLSAAHVLRHLPPTATPAIALFTAPFLLTGLRDGYEDLLAEASARGYRVALDTGWPPEGWRDGTLAEVRRWLRHCDHLLINDLEARSIAGTEDLELAITRIAAELKPASTLVVKVGARGALGLEGGRRVEHVIEPVDIFDTIGAGDAFNAGYLSARLRAAGLAESLAAGCRTAAAILARFPRQTIRAGEFADCVA
ncbi:carbohydrate kinase family protein [Mitsuaria sp. GD03876]|uniref:carbohydrate kinase family protein n=1 Tax=Mitsuaria sp. GD03876 TaxID=2975399 RepID=UPI002447E685|nr:carbohydrate kinase family protein [Mitsuaria sp. GD03876]MDH0863993.1 carbohydrate kinase family protein [Mitsuaria sp. GD03876]